MKIDPRVYEYKSGLNSFIDYVFEDKSNYPKAKDHINTITGNKYIDDDDDFLIGNSGGILMNINFVFVNTEEFSEVANHFRKTCTSILSNDGKYTYHKEGTVGYNEFWKRETKRRRKGMTILGKLRRDLIPQYNAATTQDHKNSFLQPLHITGDHYTYLNYGRIERTPNEEERKELNKRGFFKKSKIESFPRFWDGDYWNFKADLFIARNGLNLCKTKARRKGYSYKRGNQAANTVNLNPKVSIALVAYDLKFLTDGNATSAMVKRNIDWFEAHTFWQRGILSHDLTDIELGYKERATGHTKLGFQSHVLSVSNGKNPDAVVGKDCVEVDFEESGKNPLLKQTTNVTQSATESGAVSVGTMRWYGTGGTKGANWNDFKEIFYGPRAYKAMAFENIWDKNTRHTTCGFMHPQIWNYEPFMDEHGNSFLLAAYEHDAADKLEQSKYMTIDDYNIYVAQRANSPQEAFIGSIENIFSSHTLNEHIKWVTANQNSIHYRDGEFSRNNDGVVNFFTNEQIKATGGKPHPYITNVPFTAKDDVTGCWRIYHEPKRINGIIPNDLYYVVVDSVGKDKTIKEVNTKNSLNAIYIMSYPNNLGVPADCIQAIYVGRKDDSQTACSKDALEGAEYYNAKVLPETDRGTVVADFKRWTKQHMLLKNPTTAIGTNVKESISNEYGIYIGDGDLAVDGLIYLKSYLYEIVNKDEEGNTTLRLHLCLDLPTLLELQYFTSTGNFDRISALRVAMFQRLAYITKRKKSSQSNDTRTLFEQIGLYKV